MGKIIKNGIEYGGGGGGSGTGGHVIVDTDGSPVADEPKLQFTGLDVSDNSTDSETEVAAFGLNADSLDDVITSANVPANPMVTNGLVYSTTEQVVGKWIDGRPIYQRTINSGAIGTNSSKTVLTDTSISTIIDMEGYGIQNDGAGVVIPVPRAGGRNGSIVAIGWFFFNGKLNIELSSSQTALLDSYVTIKYVKASS